MRDETKSPVGTAAEAKLITPEERGAYMLSRYGKSGHERAIFIGKSQAQQDAEIRKARETTPSAELAPIPRATEPPPQAIPADNSWMVGRPSRFLMNCTGHRRRSNTMPPKHPLNARVRRTFVERYDSTVAEFLRVEDRAAKLRAKLDEMRATIKQCPELQAELDKRKISEWLA